jgi:hypothetical protein
MMTKNANIMKKLLLLITLLVSTLTFAHEKNEISKKQMYDVIKTQLDEGKISVQTAQKMWTAYIKCCE